MFELSKIKRDPPVSYRVKTNRITRFLTGKSERVFYIKEPSIGVMATLIGIGRFYRCLEEGKTLTKWQTARVTALISQPRDFRSWFGLLLYLLLNKAFTRLFAIYLYYKLPADTLDNLTKIARVKTDYDAFYYAISILAVKRNDPA